MRNVWICGVSEAAVEHHETEAATFGLSRNEFVRRRLKKDASPLTPAKIDPDDWYRSTAAFEDLGDPNVMDAAWR